MGNLALADRPEEWPSAGRALELAGDLAALSAEADGAVAVASAFEHACGEMGARLGEAAPGLLELAQLFETLSGALEGEAMGAASADLDATSVELAKAADDLNEENRALTDVVELNRQINGRLVDLIDCIRTISALVFTLKIESAPIQEGGEDMVAFAERLHVLAENSRRLLADYQATQARLDELLRAAADSHAAFQRSHRDGMRAIAAEIHASLGAVAERRQRTSAALHEVSAATREIGSRLSQCVVALQVGDSTRQRLEHAQAALHLFADLSAGRRCEVVSESLARLIEEDAEPLASRLCRLQQRQVRGAHDELAQELATIAAALPGLAADAGRLAERGLAVFGGGDKAGGSFLEDLEQKLTAGRAMVGECQRARAAVDHAANAAVTTMTDLRQRTEGLLEIVVDVTMIGTNALLKSNRFGERGRGIGLIAQELRSSSDRIGAGIHALPPALDRVVARIDSFAQSAAAFDSAALSKLDARMTSALGVFAANGREMSAALERLGHEAAGVKTVLDRAAATLSREGRAGEALIAAAEALDAAANRLGDERRSPVVDGELDRLLRGAYTMASERKIHDAFTGHVAAQKASPAVSQTKDPADDFLF